MSNMETPGTPRTRWRGNISPLALELLWIPRRSWEVLPGRENSGIPWLACCHYDPTPGDWNKIDGRMNWEMDDWMDRWMLSGTQCRTQWRSPTFPYQRLIRAHCHTNLRWMSDEAVSDQTKTAVYFWDVQNPSALDKRWNRGNICLLIICLGLQESLNAQMPSTEPPKAYKVSYRRIKGSWEWNKSKR